MGDVRVGRPLHAFPTLVGEVVRAEYQQDIESLRAFPFASWAANNSFVYDSAALPLFRRCGSAAEAFFLRPFTRRPGFGVEGQAGVAPPLTLRLQVPCGQYLIDAVVTDGRSAIAIEVDGIAFHHRSGEQLAADYLRQRRMVLRGHTVIRFTAPEVFRNAVECWRQVDAILTARRAR
jgi:REase_MTES_1575